MATIEENEGVAKIIESDARLKGIISSWKQEEALWIERYNDIHNALVEHIGECITPELISDILGEDIPYLRENNKAKKE